MVHRSRDGSSLPAAAGDGADVAAPAAARARAAHRLGAGETVAAPGRAIFPCREAGPGRDGRSGCRPARRARPATVVIVIDEAGAAPDPLQRVQSLGDTSFRRNCAASRYSSGDGERGTDRNKLVHRTSPIHRLMCAASLPNSPASANDQNLAAWIFPILRSFCVTVRLRMPAHDRVVAAI